MILWLEIVRKFVRVATADLLGNAVLLLIIASCVVCGASYYAGLYNRPNIGQDFLLGAHGTLTDILIIGIGLTLLNKLSERQRDIKRYKEEIDDFRHWQDPEASHRIAGNIRRLNRLGVHELDLAGCYLQGANLREVNLTDSNLEGANLEGTDIKFADLTTTHLFRINLSNTQLAQTKLCGAALNCANLSGADLTWTNFTRAVLYAADLSNARLSGTDFSVADLTNAKFEGTECRPDQLAKALTLYGTSLGAEVRSQLEQQPPNLFTRMGEAEKMERIGPTYFRWESRQQAAAKKGRDKMDLEPKAGGYRR